ncbi:hypothetical protein JTE90_024229 [Oedothorax gibbosus]|uniref:Geminin n=1 Tax=Oedothorax gibbosus TaxID=931172 RepID=A0AAV6TQ36_9ARAC|nr:hypothetical protein JTE90_024229 [Oedothorax gibbosus]
MNYTLFKALKPSENSIKEAQGEENGSKEHLPKASKAKAAKSNSVSVSSNQSSLDSFVSVTSKSVDVSIPIEKEEVSEHSIFQDSTINNTLKADDCTTRVVRSTSDDACINDTSKIHHDMLTCDEPGTAYWQMLAEARQKELEIAFTENEELKTELEVLETENGQLKNVLHELKSVVQVINALKPSENSIKEAQGEENGSKEHLPKASKAKAAKSNSVSVSSNQSSLDSFVSVTSKSVDVSIPIEKEEVSEHSIFQDSTINNTLKADDCTTRVVRSTSDDACINDTSKIHHDMLTCDEPGTAYWQMLAEARQKELEIAFTENEELKSELEVLETENGQLKNVLHELESVVEVINSCLE